MLAFGLIFVPAVFGNLPTQLAAAVLGDGFVWLDLGGMLLGTAALALGLFSARSPLGHGLARVFALLPLLGVICHAASWAWLSPEIRELRLSAGGTIGGLAGGDPGWERFGELHALSQGLFWTATLAALISCVQQVLSLGRTRPFL